MKLAFLTVYDEVALGLRIMASLVEKAGHQASITFFKRPRWSELTDSKPDNIAYELVKLGELRGFGYDVYPWTAKEVDLLVAHFRKLSPDVIAFGSRGVLNTINLELLGVLREHFPDILFIAGGFGPTLDPDLYLEVCDVVVRGEGEGPLLDILDHHQQGNSFDGIANVAFVQDGKMVTNPLRPQELEIDHYPFPKYMQAKLYAIDDGFLIEEDPTKDHYYTLLGRGCISSCSYCSSGQWKQIYLTSKLKHHAYVTRSVPNLMEELKVAKEKGAKRITFMDNYLVLRKKELHDLFSQYEKQIGLPFFCYFHPNQIVANPDILEAAVWAGLDYACIGIQHGHEPFCRRIYNRKTSNEAILQYAQMLYDHDVFIEYHLIEANPLQTEEDFEKSLSYVSRLPFRIERDQLVVTRLKNLPHTPLTNYIEASNLLPPSPRAWHYNAMLYQIRLVAGDETLNFVRTNEIYRQDPFLLRNLYKDLWFRKLQKGGITVASPEHFPAYYDYYSKVVKGKHIIMWGGGLAYERFAYTFRDSIVDAIIDNDPSKWGECEGILVTGPDYLHSIKPKPIVICALRKAEILDQIRSDYPQFVELP